MGLAAAAFQGCDSDGQQLRFLVGLPRWPAFGAAGNVLLSRLRRVAGDLAVQYIIDGCERRGQVGKLGVSDTLMMVQKLVAEGKVRISEHGYDELADDNIFAIEVLDGVHAAETAMIRKAKFIHEGRYAAEIPVELIEDDSGWSPYLSVDDAAKLDTVRNPLRTGDVAAAGRYGRMFELVPVTE